MTPSGPDFLPSTLDFELNICNISHPNEHSIPSLRAIKLKSKPLFQTSPNLRPKSPASLPEPELEHLSTPKPSQQQPQPHIPILLADGQSGTIHLQTPTTILKLPHINHPTHGTTLDEILHEKTIYLYLQQKALLHPHPYSHHILQYLGTYQNGLLFPYHPLGSLRTFIHGPNDSYKNTGSLQILRTNRGKWTYQITSAIKFLHENGVMNCDISTANTLITNEYSIVLCDFSSSMIHGLRPERKTRCSRWYKRVSPPLPSTRPLSPPPSDSSSINTFDGTDGPLDKEKNMQGINWNEQLDNFTYADDIWALGTVVYELFCRKRMWAGVSNEEKVRRYWEGNWPELDECECCVGRIIRGCWEEKFGDVGEVLREVEELGLGLDGGGEGGEVEDGRWIERVVGEGMEGRVREKIEI